MDVGQAHVAAAKAERHLLVVQPQQVQQRRMQIRDVMPLLHGVKAQFIGRPVGDAALDAAAGQPG